MIVATAGHVDHGKTALVRALTGVDTDRTEEEKRRGLTIDLGFAYMDGPSLRRIGFVDVPGHERFIRNMLAGVAAVDFVLLVIAADDGPMPQTREHLAILHLLGLRHGAVVVSKTDRVSGERLLQVTEGIPELVEGTCLTGAPVFPVSAQTGAGMDALKRHLTRCSETLPWRKADGNFRLAVDRCFTVDGAGLVVTGTVFDGSVRKDEHLRVVPGGIPARVRDLRGQGQRRDQVVAGERCALNLSGSRLDREAIRRGDWVVAEPAELVTRRLDVELGLLPSEQRALKHWTPVHLHLGAADVTARVALLGRHSLGVGERGLAQLVLERPIHGLHGDRFIIRDQSAWRTLGGGKVIDPTPPRRGRGRPERLSLLEALADADHARALGSLLELSPTGIFLPAFVRTRNLTPEQAAALADATPGLRIATREGPLLITENRWQEVQREVLNAVARWHALDPASVGPGESALAERLGRTLPGALVRAAIRALLEKSLLVRQGFNLRLPDHRPRLETADAALLEAVTHALRGAGLRPPLVGELADQLGLERQALMERLQSLSRLGYLERVAPNRYFLPETVETLADLARELAEESPDRLFDAAGYRDRSGIGRNLTIQVLEHLDRLGITRFDGERRGLR
ncbi:MAG: selenocysteine-specific translation elongation factor [Ectothiorhodospiraceae bacterium]|nr:selenocysteine-specific translation elongation factor [Ectothiorhodospiraceae bacterium]